MVSRRYRRLLQRRLRRRPLLPFLLAATVAMDAAVVASGFGLADNTGDDGLFILGVVVGQIGLLGIWVAFTWQGIVLRLGIAILASQVIAIVLSRQSDISIIIDLSVTSAVSLFLLVATIIVSITSNLSYNRWKPLFYRLPYTFSVGTLLLLTTVVAVAIVIIKQGNWEFLSDRLVIAQLVLDAMMPPFIWFASKQFRIWETGIGKTVLLLILVSLASMMPLYHMGQISILLIWLIALRSRRVPLPPFQLRLLRANEEAAPESPERPLERHQVAELKEINVVV